MKKNMKKLVLSRETLRALGEDAARRVVAGAFDTQYSCGTDCGSRMVSYCDGCVPMD